MIQLSPGGFLKAVDEDTSFTEGSVLFRGASVISEDNENLLWDDTNKRFGIGGIPETNLHVFGSVQIGSSPNIYLLGETLQIRPISGNASFLLDRPSLNSFVSADWVTRGDIGVGWSQQIPPNKTYLQFLDRVNNVPVIIFEVGGNVGIGTIVPTALLHIDQSSTTSAKPVLLLDQADISEEMMEFVTTIGTGNAIEVVGAKTLTSTHFIKITIPGELTRYIPCGTIA